jgi:soluble lytic murein transglycosylase-like protein
VIKRESRGNPRVISQGNYGLMQIKLATARGMGYRGTAAGLLDADTNMTYAVKYLAGAYRVAGGNADRAVSYYAGGYYYAAKRKGLNGGNDAGGLDTFAAAGPGDRANVATQQP